MFYFFMDVATWRKQYIVVYVCVDVCVFQDCSKKHTISGVQWQQSSQVCKYCRPTKSPGAIYQLSPSSLRMDAVGSQRPMTTVATIGTRLNKSMS